MVVSSKGKKAGTDVFLAFFWGETRQVLRFLKQPKLFVKLSISRFVQLKVVMLVIAVNSMYEVDGNLIIVFRSVLGLLKFDRNRENEKGQFDMCKCMAIGERRMQAPATNSRKSGSVAGASVSTFDCINQSATSRQMTSTCC